MKTALIVEDEIIIAMDLEKKLGNIGINVLGIESTGEGAIAKLKENKTDVVMMDIRLRGHMDGITAAIIANRVFMTPVIFVSAHTDENTLKRSENANPYAYIRKPFSQEDIFLALKMAEQRQTYEKKATAGMRIQVLDSMMKVLFLKYPREESHTRRVTELCCAIGAQYRLDQEATDQLLISSDLHDIGKITIDERILNKQDPLDQQELEEIKSHPSRGAIILRTVESFASIAEIVEKHHEGWDGKGYPNGLAREAIPWESRVIAVADAFDAMTNLRPYQIPVSENQALWRLEKGAGTQFDPQIVRVFCQMFRRRQKSKS